MIILISWPVIAVILGLYGVFAAICAVIYGVQSSWTDEKVTWLKTYTVKQKWGLFALLVAIVGSVAAFVCGWIYHNGYAGTFGFIGWFILSLVAGALCSPLRLAFTGADYSMNQGCNPLVTLAQLASAVLIMAFAWVFILIAIFRKSTWRLLVGILAAVLLFFAGAACVLSIQSDQEGKAQQKAVEQMVAQQDFEGAMEAYLTMGDMDKYLETWYAQGMWYLEQGEYYKAQTTFAQLAEEYQYSDAMEQSENARYLSARKMEEGENYGGAAQSYAQLGNFRDAQLRYPQCCYLEGKAQMEDGSFDKAITWFEKAGGYEDAKQLLLYNQIRVQAVEDLAEAEELLRQLPRDFLDVDVMLAGIETYRAWGGTYTFKKATGHGVSEYDYAVLRLVYEQPHWPKIPKLTWEVTLCANGRRGSEYDSNGQMPEGKSFIFTSGSDPYWSDFTITKKEIKVEKYSKSSYNIVTKETYIFKAE